MGQITTSIERCPSESETLRLIRALVGFNDTQAPHEDYCDLAVLSRDAGELVGGLLGYTHWNWLYIQQLWVADAFRRRGLGSNLMLTAEREACDRGCLHAHCDTFDFQALPFYQKLGYTVFGSLEDYPIGHTRYFLRKRNIVGGA
jgi:ribosomal protein S18 acetylase RimI-like enzyme